MTEGGALQKLIHEAAHCRGIESAAFAMRIHILLEISVAVLEDQNQLGLGVDNIVESDNVDMFQLLHQRDFADRGRGGSFLGVEMNLLERNNLVCGPGSTLGWCLVFSVELLNAPGTTCLVNRCVGSFTWNILLASMNNKSVYSVPSFSSYQAIQHHKGVYERWRSQHTCT